MATKKKGAPSRARRARANDETELGGPGDVISALIDRLSPVLMPLIVERLGRQRPPEEGRLLRIETQQGYLSTTVHQLKADVAGLKARVAELESEAAQRAVH